MYERASASCMIVHLPRVLQHDRYSAQYCISLPSFIIALPQPMSPIHNVNPPSLQPVFEVTDTLEIVATNLISALDVIEAGFEHLHLLKLTVHGLKEVCKRIVVCHLPNSFPPFSQCETD